MKTKETGLKTKKAGISILVVLTLMISGLAVFAAPVSVAEDYVGGPYGGVLRVALMSHPSSLNPLSASLDESADQVMDLLYESLGRIDPYTLKLVPWMAQRWAINPADETIVSVTLKSDILWHDGSPVTLDDVTYTFGPSGYDIDYVSSMTKDSANNTIIFDLDAPDSRFFGELMQMKIVPSGFTATSSPKGCGPFKLVSYDATSTVVEAFDDHFVARPYIGTIIYTYYPYATDWDSVAYPWTQLTEDPRNDGFYRAAYDLIQDKIDFIAWDLLTEQIYTLIEIDGNTTGNTLTQHPNAGTFPSSGLSQWHLCFNNAEGHPFNDPVLRKAISRAIDKKQLTSYDIGGGLEEADSVISKYNLPWFNNTIDYPSYDIAAARKILKDAHYEDYDSDGYIDMPGPNPAKPKEGATPLSLRLYGPLIEDVTPYTMSTNLITWFEELGIRVELISNTTEVHWPNITAGNFDMYLANVDPTLDPQFLYDLYHSKNIGTTNLLNFQGKYKVDNYSLVEELAMYGGNTSLTWEVQLEHTNLNGTVHVYHNDMLVTDITKYTIGMDAGLFTLDSTYVIDYLNDTFNITYSYLPFDSLMEKANAQMDPAMRAKYIKEIQAAFLDLMPSVPLFSYMVSHAYKTDIAPSTDPTAPPQYIPRYPGWVQTLGGINNYWSFTNLKNHLWGDSVVSLTGVKNFLSDGESMSLFVRLQDLTGAPLEAEQLRFTGEGTFGTPIFGDGQFTVQYTAPSTANSRTITLGVEVFTKGYESSSDTLDITIHPIVRNFNIDISRGATSLLSGNTTTVTVIVKDRTTNTAISGANVVLTMTPSGLGGYLESVSGATDATGEFVTTFGSANVTIDTTFRITAYITKEGYVDAEQTTSISVDRDPTITLSTDRGLLGLPAPSFMALLVMLCGLSVTYAAYRRKKRY